MANKAEPGSSSTRDTRSATVRKELFGEMYKEQSEFEYKAKLQTGAHIIGRMLYLCQVRPGRKTVSHEKASNVVCEEIHDDWINKNVYPNSERAVARKIQNEYETFLKLRKQEQTLTYKKTDAWKKKAEEFNSRMTKNAFDLRTRNKEYQKSLETIHGVKMTAEDEEFYVDNCHGSYVATCKGTVSAKWTKQTKREQKRHESNEKKRREIADDTEKEKVSRRLAYDECLRDSGHNDSTDDPEFALPSTVVGDVPAMTEKVKTRQSTEAEPQINQMRIQMTVKTQDMS